MFGLRKQTTKQCTYLVKKLDITKSEGGIDIDIKVVVVGDGDDRFTDDGIVEAIRKQLIAQAEARGWVK